MTDTPIVNEEEVIDSPEVVEEVTETAPLPGEKTDSVLLLKSLKEEKERRRVAEAKLAELETDPGPDEEILSDEGQSLKRELDSIKDQLALTEARGKFPQLKDKAAEFEDFRTNPENRGMSVATAAKAFLAENGLLNTPTPARKGLETDTGGGRQAPKIGRTEEEIAELRKSNFRQYSKELKAGTLRA